ncbi:MAG: hypothetical protein ACM3N9_07350, partial [Syntrophothermus sp.]
MKKLFLLIIVLVCSSSLLRAQFTISGEFRPRAEYRNGYLQLGDSTMHGYGDILGRSRISFDYTQDKISTRISLQHAFMYGENNYSSDTITKNTINIFEGWFRYAFTKNTGVKIGRMAISYDDQRLFGYSNWKQWGATHDLLMIQTAAPGINYKADFGFAVNNPSSSAAYLTNYMLKNYKYMSYLWQQKKFFNDALSISVTAILDVNQKPSVTSDKITLQTLYVINAGDTIGTTILRTTSKVTETFPNTVYGRGTIGFYAIYNWKKLGVTASAYYQGGHYKDGRKISAYLLSATAGFQVLKPLKLMVGYDYLSGNDVSDTSTLKKTLKGFSTLWGTNHSFYGYMDPFTSYLGKDALQYGLQMAYARGTWNFSQKTSAELTYRMYSMPFGYLPTAKAPAYKTADKNLGSELDLMFVYKPLNNLELNAAYCYYFKSETRE